MINDIYLGIDIGGSAFKYGWGNAQSGLLHYGRLNLEDTTLAAMQKACDEILARVDIEIGLSQIKAIGIGSPGTIDHKTGKLTGVNPNLPEWTNLPPGSIITPQAKEKYGIVNMPVCADNDANLMALAEAQQLIDKKAVIGITIGSGIGCGFVYKGEIYHGATGFAMELGHVTVTDNGELCNCGRKGCLEAYAAVNGMRNRIGALHPHLNPVTMADILLLSKQYEDIDQLVCEGIRFLGRSIANLVICLDADAVILGGGVIDLTDYQTDDLIRTIIAYLPETNIINLKITKAGMGNRAGVMGAVIFAEHVFL